MEEMPIGWHISQATPTNSCANDEDRVSHALQRLLASSEFVRGFSNGPFTLEGAQDGDLGDDCSPPSPGRAAEAFPVSVRIDIRTFEKKCSIPALDGHGSSPILAMIACALSARSA
jgi:hypothetical protein